MKLMRIPVIAFAIGKPAGFLDAMLERGRPARTANTSTSRNHPVALQQRAGETPAFLRAEPQEDVATIALT